MSIQEVFLMITLKKKFEQMEFIYLEIKKKLY